MQSLQTKINKMVALISKEVLKKLFYGASNSIIFTYCLVTKQSNFLVDLN